MICDIIYIKCDENTIKHNANTIISDNKCNKLLKSRVGQCRAGNLNLQNEAYIQSYVEVEGIKYQNLF